jgi:septal ring factor EnvC (AmiA/AmiB activator)
MTESLLLDCESIRSTFQEWQAEHQSLDAQLVESLSALAAFQSHLDAWQQQLANEREELRKSHEQLDLERAAAGDAQVGQDKTAAEAAGELSAAREKISTLSATLLARTEELRLMDQRRTEVANELELTRTREKEFKAALEEQKRAMEEERAQQAEELRNLREMLKREGEAAPAAEASAEPVPSSPSQPPRSGTNNGQQRAHENPVLGSIVEQFGKLRQQRAMDRQVQRKAR